MKSQTYKRVSKLKKINRGNINVPKMYIKKDIVATGCHLRKLTKYFFGQHLLKDKLILQ